MQVIKDDRTIESQCPALAKKTTDSIMSVFDSKAQNWDNNPKHFLRSEAIAANLIKRIPLSKQMTALEYGAGTGILSHILKDKFSNITLMDNSIEMVKIIKEKVQKLGITNFTPLYFDLEKDAYNDSKFNIILSQMVLHHIDNIPLILQRLSSLMLPQSYLAIADLYPEDGSFHDSDFKGHFGVNPDELSQQLKTLGFYSVSYETCYSLEKETENGELKAYPIFLLIAQK